MYEVRYVANNQTIKDGAEMQQDDNCQLLLIMHICSAHSRIVIAIAAYEEHGTASDEVATLAVFRPHRTFLACDNLYRLRNNYHLFLIGMPSQESGSNRSVQGGDTRSKQGIKTAGHNCIDCLPVVQSVGPFKVR